MPEMGLALDLGIILVYFGLIAAIGLYMGRKEKSLHDFALGGRQIPWWAVMASIIAAETSAATFLGAPGEGFEKKSLAYAQLTLGVIIGRWVVGNFFLKPYYTYRVYTVYDYLGVRFGPMTKNFVSGLFLVMRTLASGTRLFIPSLVMVLAWKLFANGGQAVSFSQESVNGVGPYLIAIVLLTVLTGLYTAKGGIKAVIWTDVVQATLMFGTAVLAIFFLLHQVGGFGEVVKAVPSMGRSDGYFLTGFEPTAVHGWQVAQKMIPSDGANLPMGPWDYVKLIFTGDYTLFSALIAASAMNMAAFGTDQDMVQRLLTSTDHHKARRSLLTAAFMDIPIALVFTFIGVLLFVYYQKDPTFKPPANADVFGSYILNVMPVGLRGLVLAGVFATAMGSLSAALNSLATSATNDFYVPFWAKPKGLDQQQIVRAAKYLTVLFGFLMVVVAGEFAFLKVSDPKIRIIPVVLGIAGYILGPMLGVFLLGMFTKSRGSDRGNVIAIIFGLLATSVLGDLPGKISPRLSVTIPWLPNIAFTWYSLIGAVAVLAVGIWFRTPDAVLANAKQRASQAESGDELPIDMRVS